MIATSYISSCRGCDSTCCGDLCSERRGYELVPTTPLPIEKVKEKSYSKFVGKNPWNNRKKKR